MNIPRICTPVIGSTLESFLAALKKTQEVADMVELRVDFIENVSVHDLDTIHKACQKEAILTCRPKSEGGKYEGSEEQRIELLQHAIGLFSYVDIELSTMKAHTFTKNEKTKIIISYHNFEESPGYWDMQNIIHEMKHFEPDIIKIATLLQKDFEVTKIYRLLTNKPHHENRIVVGMGAHGRVTRIVAPLLGSFLTYSAALSGEVAPGQISLEEMKKIYECMNI